MRIEGNIRVVKSSAATEVFITAQNPYVNFVMHLPPEAEVKNGETIELVQEVIKPLTKDEAAKREMELPGQIKPAAG